MKNFKTKQYWFLLCILAFIWIVEGCKKKSNDAPQPGITTPPPTPGYENSYPLKPGNYWIYRTQLFSDSFSQVFTTTDSVWIEKDTIIQQKRYFIERSTAYWPLKKLLYDSAGCIVSEIVGIKDLIHANYMGDTLLKRGRFYRVNLDIDREVIVYAGKFKTINCMLLYKIDRSKPNLDDRPLYNDQFIQLEQLMYANNVGLVRKVNYYYGNRIESKLERYQIK